MSFMLSAGGRSGSFPSENNIIRGTAYQYTADLGSNTRKPADGEYVDTQKHLGEARRHWQREAVLYSEVCWSGDIYLTTTDRTSTGLGYSTDHTKAS